MKFFPLVLIFTFALLQGCERAPSVINIDEDIQLLQLKDSVFMHITWHHAEGYGRFASNGLVIIRNGKAILVDTPIDQPKTARLVNYLEETMKVKTEKLIPGHFHDDCIGGMPYLHGLGVVSVANVLTAEKCLSLGLPVPQMPFSESFTFDHYGETIVCRYFGGGHTEDNIVVWLPEKQILFGGCLVKSTDSKGLGNIADAVVDEWDSTIRKILEAFPDIRWVIPGHGDAGGKELLYHTIELVEAYKANQPG
jgi:metallo-beta-lactamase class B